MFYCISRLRMGMCAYISLWIFRFRLGMGFGFALCLSKYFDFYILVSVGAWVAHTLLYYVPVWCWGNSFFI